MSPPDFPDRISAYAPERLLGHGAMAAVYLCRTRDGQPVAVKWLEQQHPPLMRRFEAEIRVLERLSHPGIVQFIDHGTWQGRPYLVMEYIDGPDLRDYAAKLHQRPADERYARCRTIGQAIAEALACLHENNLIHRDVKPSNVLIGSDGRAVLADFGVVKEEDAFNGERTSIGQMIGTVAYAAPEQIRCERIDPRADLYGLGATLYYALTLRRPHEDLQRGDEHMPPVPSTYDPNIPPELEAAVMRLLSPEPRRRYADAREVARVLSSGSSAGMTLAGRQQQLEQVRACLDRAAGGVVLVRPTGAPGTNRDWLVETLQHGARRRGLAVWRPADGEPALRESAGGVLGIIRDNEESPPGWPVTEIELLPLGIADVRRSLVATAPLTEDSAQASEQLHRLTGGLPALLVPLLSQHTDGARFSLPSELPEPASVEDFFDDLDLDELDVLAALSAIGRPATAAQLETIAMVPAEIALAAPAARGIVRQVDGRWRFIAELFASAALARAPDPDGLLARAQEQTDHGAVEAAALDDVVERISGLSASGKLADALSAAQAAVEQASGGGDRARECRALCALGQVQLDLGLVVDASRHLADATALAKAASLIGERQISHALRARASLESRPGRRAAAAAIDRLLPLVASARGRPPGPADALVYGTWAHAAGVLGDRRAFQRARSRAATAVAVASPLAQRRMQLAIAQGAAALGQRALSAELLDELEESLGDEALLRWEAGRLKAALQGTEPPPTSPLAYGLTPEVLAAFKRRSLFIGGRLRVP
ncbi:MAG: putative Ser/Thr protein kinase [Myxococcota bacterium]|jgi:predicted Ser/Thr protein kinase